jgi:hypothetical protein
MEGSEDDTVPIAELVGNYDVSCASFVSSDHHHRFRRVLQVQDPMIPRASRVPFWTG